MGRGLFAEAGRVALVAALREALASCAPRIRAAFVYGSVAKGENTAKSDIDLMVIGDDVTHFDCFDGLVSAERVLNRAIHAHFVSPDEWKHKLATRSAFFTRINARPKIFVLGSEGDLRP